MVEALRGAPQLGQYSSPAAISVEQTAHFTGLTAAASAPGAAPPPVTSPRGAPQLEQYSVPGGLTVLQTEQEITELDAPSPLFPVEISPPGTCIGEPQLGQYPSSGTTFSPQVGHTCAAWEDLEALGAALLGFALANFYNLSSCAKGLDIEPGCCGLYRSCIYCDVSYGACRLSRYPAKIVYLDSFTLHSVNDGPVPLDVTSFAGYT